MRSSASQTKAIKLNTGYIFGANAGELPSCSGLKVQLGFTLTELISVLVIMGILAAVAVPRLFDSNAFQARGATDQVFAALRFGQKTAIAQHRNVSVNISSAADSSCGAELTGGNVNCSISSSVSVSPMTVTFNALGQPVPNAAISVVAGGTTIHIEAETGYVH